MSLYSALYAGVSGLSAQSAAMAGVADNITNINTIGYKGVDTQFRTLVTDGRARSTYSAGGVQAAPQSLVSREGVLQASSSSTDLGIAGAGFFVVRDGTAADSTVAFTRAGSFKPDKEGFLRNTSGFYLQGWPLNADGKPTSTGDLTGLVPVRLNQLAGTASATSKIALRVNLDSTATATPTYDPAANQITADPSIANYTRTMDVYDQQGGAHTVSIGFIKTGPNNWSAEIYSPGTPNVQLGKGNIVFNPDGSLGSIDAGLQSITPAWGNGAGASPITLALGTAGTPGGLDGLTQFATESAMISTSTDGGLLGNISSIAVSEAGEVSAVFENGTARKVFQLPVATFANPDGLTRMSGNAYGASDASGTYSVNMPGTLSAGTINANQLEASNVDLAQEFTNMIRFQRAYSASSKIITTVDDMLQEVSNLKR